jgi:preprotein translocase subunit YajC
MNNLLSVILMGSQAGGGDGSFMPIVSLALIIGVFYFFMIRPQQKKMKEQRKFRDELKVGDKVVTTGGIYGKIAEMSERTVILEVEGKMRIKVDKSVLIGDPGEIPPQK